MLARRLHLEIDRPLLASFVRPAGFHPETVHPLTPFHLARLTAWSPADLLMAAATLGHVRAFGAAGGRLVGVTQPGRPAVHSSRFKRL